MQSVIDKANQIVSLARSVETNLRIISDLKDSEGDPLTSGTLSVNDIDLQVTGVGTLVGSQITALENSNTLNLAEIDKLCDDIKTLIA
jgi:hypothetical protein